MDFQDRLKKVQQQLSSTEPEACLITNPINRQYITGFSGTSGVALITTDASFLLTDFRYIQAAAEEAPYFSIIDHHFNLEKKLAELISDLEITNLGIEEDHISYGFYKRLSNQLPSVNYNNCYGLIENMRIIKEPAEINAIQTAAEISDQAISHIVKMIKPGMSENEVATEIIYFVKKTGADISPRFIVASGYRAALPHGYASEKVIQDGEFLMIDFGAIWEGYYSDMTRTFIIGNPTSEQSAIYNTVLNSQLASISAAKSENSFSHLYNSSISELEKDGYQLGHGLGHGLGLEVHEQPFINSKINGMIKENMTFTLEPGIYFSGWGGVRIEDTVHISTEGCQPLNKFPKELITI